MWSKKEAEFIEVWQQRRSIWYFIVAILGICLLLKSLTTPPVLVRCDMKQFFAMAKKLNNLRPQPHRRQFYSKTCLSLSQPPASTQDHFQKCFHPQGNTAQAQNAIFFYSPTPVGGAKCGVWDIHIKPPHEVSSKHNKQTRLPKNKA